MRCFSCREASGLARPCILNVVYVFLLWSMCSYCSSMYSYCCLCILIVVYVFLEAATLTEVFPCFFLGCKANARVILAKTGQGPHSSKIVVFVLCIVCFVLFYVLFVCKCVLPPGDNPIAVNKYINKSHRGHRCLSVVSVVCCQVEVSATDLSLVQRSPTDCGASLCVI